MRVKRLAVVLLFAPALVARAAGAEEKPAVLPTRDVDVTYRMIPQAEGIAVMSQRMRWSVAAGKLRVDPPSPGLYMIIDTRAKRMAVVRPGEQAVLDMPAPAAPEAELAAFSYTRIGADTVAGQPCTNWQTADAHGAGDIVCLTPDGVMLRASDGAKVLLEAARVSYAPQDPAAFVPPDGFRHVEQGAP